MRDRQRQLSNPHEFPGEHGQLSLFEEKNPMQARLGSTFFKRVPASAGIYVMLDRSKRILYIGKSKNLRQRLNSYKTAQPSRVSKKIWKLLFCVHEIRWEKCLSEEAALLRENFLLRTFKPPYNEVNTRPESYACIGLQREREKLRIRFTMNAERQKGEDLYGAFKARRKARQTCSAVGRLLWVVTHSVQRMIDLPLPLIRKDNPAVLTIPMELEEAIWWEERLADYFSGLDRGIVDTFRGRLEKVPSTDALLTTWLEEALVCMEEFFIIGPARNAGLASAFIEQDEIDDLLVRMNASR